MVEEEENGEKEGEREGENHPPHPAVMIHLVRLEKRKRGCVFMSFLLAVFVSIWWCVEKNNPRELLNMEWGRL